MDHIVTLAQHHTTAGQKILNIIYVIDFQKGAVLLGRKVRGFGAEKWNGFGGKVEPSDPSVLAAAVRELEEECGLSAHPAAMLRVGVNYYRYPEALEKRVLEVHVYVVDARACSGAVVASEEMNPIEFIAFASIPLEHMWVDDPFWLPHLLAQVEQYGSAEALAEDSVDGFFMGFFKFDSFEALSTTEPPTIVWGASTALKTAAPSDGLRKDT